MKIKLVTGLGIISLLLFSCIQTPEPESPRRINFLFNVDNVGNQITVGQDSIEVNEIKLLADRINLAYDDGDNGATLQTSVDALIFAYESDDAGDDETVLSARIGFEDIERFEGMELFVDQPTEGENIQDGDFFGEEMNFSFIITGTYNTQAFTYQSGVSFSKVFDFDNVIQLNNTDETLILRVTADIREILVDQSRNVILNPQDSANKAVIDSLFQESIDVDSFAADLF